MVRVWTEVGNFDVRLDALAAPRTVANFLWYVDQGAYTSGTFYRTVHGAAGSHPFPIDVVQGGARADFPPAPPIQLERTSVTRLSHKAGTISMARAGPNTAAADFFICLADAPALDFGGRRNPDGQGFAAFGTVTRGMDIVAKLHQAPRRGEALTPPIRILRIERIGERRR